MKRELEKRSYRGSLLVSERGATAAGAGSVTGYAAVYDSSSAPLTDAHTGRTFIERIAPGAFKRALARKPDVRLLVNHDPSLLLARTKSGTLRLFEDINGLKIDATLPDTQLAHDVLTLLRRGDMDQMSFGFHTLKDEWSEAGGVPVRTLIDLTIDDVSVVTYPAYPATMVHARSGLSSAAVKRIIDLWQLTQT
jgi:HK97 family phage prohead protease